MEHSKYEILVVDDGKDAARDYARFISNRTGFSVIWAVDAKEACRYASENELKVIVLDQRMPVPGTELKEALAKSCPDAKFIMLTGEASKSEIGAAVNLGYDKYLEKSNVKELPGTVVSLYASYETDQEKRIKYLKPIKRVFVFRKALPYLVSIYDKQLINDNYVDELQKKTIYRILAGEEKEFRYSAIVSQELVIGSSMESTGGFQLKDPTESLGIVESALKKTFSVESKLSVQESVESTVRRMLPNTSDNSIAQRVIEASPVYHVYKVFMGYRMFLGGSLKRVVETVRMFTGTYNLKQIDYYNDNIIYCLKVGNHTGILFPFRHFRKAKG